MKQGDESLNQGDFDGEKSSYQRGLPWRQFVLSLGVEGTRG